ncbi:MAG: CPBP family intramembrane metalloprotease [Candidatus Omnitrophica bacterium]|nr:CPBP family intramembrane metalloprotease [Candidatus Omnitrophota bacterium]
MSRKNIYIILIIIGILTIVYIELFSHTFGQKDFPFDTSKLENIFSSNYSYDALTVTFILFYVFLFLSGIINIVILIFKKLNKSLDHSVEYSTFLSLNDENVAKIFFIVVYFNLFVYLLSLFFFNAISYNKTYVIREIVLANLIIHLGIIFIMMHAIPLKDISIKPRLKHFIFAFKIYSMLLPLLYIVVTILGFISKKFNFYLPPQPVVYLLFTIDEKWLMYFLIFEGFLIAPLSEEFLFRGFIYKFMRKKYNWLISSLFNSLFFAFLHKSISGFFVIFLISMTLCYVYEKTQNILASVSIHSLHNLLGIWGIFVFKRALNLN